MTRNILVLILAVLAVAGVILLAALDKVSGQAALSAIGGLVLGGGGGLVLGRRKGGDT
jgi:hypothetical protein